MITTLNTYTSHLLFFKHHLLYFMSFGNLREFSTKINLLSLPVLQIRAGQQSINTNLWPLTTHIYHLMITVFFPEIFFFLFFDKIILFPRNSFKVLELVFLEFKPIYKTQTTSMFSFYPFIFYLLFHNHSVY